MSITATECARAIQSAQAIAATGPKPAPVVWVPERKVYRPLTKGEITRGERYLARQPKRDTALLRVAQAYEREQLRLEAEARAKRDRQRLEAARTTCRKVLAARG